MHAFHYGRKLTAAAIAVGAATLLAGTLARSDEKAEEGVRLEFWKGHFARGSLAYHDWDHEKEIPAVCARCHGASQ